jgi:Flp pilus assembly protein TadG
MRLCQVREKVFSGARRFAGATGGNTAMIFALCCTAIMVAGGGAIDFARAVDARTRMAAALDAAGLAVGSSSKNMTTAEMKALAQKYFDANYNGNMVNTPGPVQLSAAGNIVTMSVSGTLPTTLLKIAGINQLSVGVNNEVTRAHVPKKMHIVLALDNTGSMSSQGRMTALKSATHNLLDMLEDAVEADGDIRVGIVPFATVVNVGSSNYNQNWIKWADWDEENGDWECDEWKKVNGNWQCQDYDWVPHDHDEWNGCIMDRDQNHDTKNTTPSTGNAATLFPADDEGDTCPTKIQGLTTNWTTLHSKVNAMSPTGNTNTTIGLAWAWQTLTGGAPMNAPAAAADTHKVIIFMTDGDNTENRWSTSASTIDARMQVACTNVKAGGITLYTVLMIDGNETLLKNCASDASKYFKVTQSNQIISVFEAIGYQLANLHLSK